MALPGASRHCSAPHLGSVAQSTVSLSWHSALWAGTEPCSTAVLHKQELWHAAQCSWHYIVPHWHCSDTFLGGLVWSMMALAWHGTPYLGTTD